MSLASDNDRLQIPISLEQQLHGFRRHVWWIKMLEVLGLAVAAFLFAYLLVFCFDRIADAPAWLRMTCLVAAVLGLMLIPLQFHRWIWRRRTLDQLARLLSQKLPRVGDQLLGVIELAESDSEQARSRALCAAAIQQVAEDASQRNLHDASPSSRHRRWLVSALALLALVVGLGVWVPDAAWNAWQRFSAPWNDVPRFTFANVGSLPPRVIVAHGEPFTLRVTLADNTWWKPAAGRMRLGQQQPVRAQLQGQVYEFAFPPQINPNALQLRIGDARQTVQLEPTLRPELTGLLANVDLPEYLGRAGDLERDVRGGSITLVRGSRARFTATTSRPLVSALVNGTSSSPREDAIPSPETLVESHHELMFEWEDEYGLSGKEPFTLSIEGRDDEHPTLVCEGVPRRMVVLDSEQLSFKVQAHDDFGVKRVGMEWEGFPGLAGEEAIRGERILSAGGNDKVSLDLVGTFTAQSLEIEPQPIKLRIFAEDYFPDRERTYSPTFVLHVLNAEQHAIWLTEELSKWHRQSLEVRDRELQLYERNKQLRNLRPEELDQPGIRKQVETQARAERSNGRRLGNLTRRGEDLVRQATRNPEFGVGHLEKWAEMLQVLKNISSNRMPSVADLLKEAAQANAGKVASKSVPPAGVNRDASSGSESKDKDKKQAAVPQVGDRESSHQPDDPEEQIAPQQGGGKPKLSLPVTTLKAGRGSGGACPIQDKMDEAIAEQEQLLAEFEKVANELNKILANLEGSTLVKRLKAESRKQYRIAGRISDGIDSAFGQGVVPSDSVKRLEELSTEQVKSSQVVSYIMDDMHAYFERRRFVQFKTVLDEMKAADVVGNLRQLGDKIPKEHGLSIAQCEYWSDHLDRWAEDLVDPASGGT